MECPVCHETAQLTCKSCFKVTYCSPEHQREHWNYHKHECQSFKIEEADNKALGQQALATRNLKAGTIILDESVCLQAPQWEHSSFESAPTFPCTSCGLELDGESFQLCSVCKWPVCGIHCEKDPIHECNECKLFASHVPFPPSQDISPSDISMCILMIRGMSLKNHSLQSYENLQKLQHEPGDLTKLSERAQRIEQYIRQLQKLLPAEKIELGTCRRVMELTDINGFTVRLEEPTMSHGSRFRTNVYVYLRASRFNHSCSPNCTWAIGASPTNKIRIRAAISVKANEPLTISYLMRRNMFGTAKRQQFIKEFGFTCRCPRCLDPTELGTYLSAMTCKSCKLLNSAESSPGYLLPIDPLDLSTLAPWKCNNCDSTSKTCELLPTIDRVYSIIEKHMYSSSELSSRCAEFCLFVIAKYRGHVLHPNHWLIGEATRAIQRIYTATLNTLDSIGLDRYIEYCSYLMVVEGQVNRGVTPGTSHLQRNILKALASKMSKYCEKQRKEEVSNILSYCIKLHTQARKYFIDEPPGTGDLVNRFVEEIDSTLKVITETCAACLST